MQEDDNHRPFPGKTSNIPREQGRIYMYHSLYHLRRESSYNWQKTEQRTSRKEGSEDKLRPLDLTGFNVVEV